MKPTEQLVEEHDAIKIMLKIMEKVAQKLEAGEKVAPEDLEAMVDFIRTFADKCHHGKEEDLLFSAMTEAGIPGENGPIAVMLMEHDKGRSFVRGLAEGIAGYKNGEKGAARQIAKNARNYASLLVQHIDKENNILYPMADMHISAEKQEELLEKFEKVEEEIIGPGRHRELHQTLERLRDTYLGA